MSTPLLIGLISDTHGLVRPEVEHFLARCDHIVHAGDICDNSVLEKLALIAPVTAVRGNNDKGAWANNLREAEVVQLGDIRLYVIHDLSDLDIDPIAAGVQVVVSGHSHKPLVEHRAGVIYVNPGSAGPRRFKLPITAAALTVRDGQIEAHIQDLAVARIAL